MFLYNRTVRHKDAPKICGGIGTFVKDDLFNKYNINIIDKSIEGILGLLFKNKLSGFFFIVFNCYLPPISSPYGKNDTHFFSYLISQLYMNNDVDIMFFCGDYNARIGHLKDSIKDIDCVPQRHALDEVLYGHGESLVIIVKDRKLCILNGRLDVHNDNFTFISDSDSQKLFIQPHIIQSKFSHTLRFNIMGQGDLH